MPINFLGGYDMNPCIVSFFMDNINMKTVGLQKSVVEKFNKSKIPHYIIKVDVPHPIGIDYFWAVNGAKPLPFEDADIPQQMHHDVILFLDIDCVPLSDDAIDLYLEKASQGILVGNIQRTNHLDNGQHVFAAPSAVAISKETYLKLGKPSAVETGRSDVAEEWTWAAESAGVPVEMFMPLRYDSAPKRYEWEKNQPPYWSLKDGMPVYGMGTTYGTEDGKELFYHNFQIRIEGQEEVFWKKCESILTA